MFGRAAEGGDGPNIGLPESLTEVDFRAVGRKTQDRLVAFIFGELKRIAAGSKHHEKLVVTIHRRSEGDGAAVRGKNGVIHRSVPVADFPDRGRPLGSTAVESQMIYTVTGCEDEKNQ